ncbi:MAG: hypothetical protein NDI69_00430 [Bacteriovoracaceae bacterium]|nr:hypothetical protein [Bacteriovoracaceae bacterium]
MDVRLLILSLFLLVSCMPTAQVSKGKLASSETTGGTDGGTGTETASAVSWNYLGAKSSSIIINVSNLNNAYIIGTPLEDYLSTVENFNGANYCLVSSYSLGGVPYELRSRIVPISYYDFNLKRTVRNLRVDFDDVTNSSAYCDKTLRVKNSNGEYVTDTTSPPTHQYDPSQICPTCTSMLTATRVRLFKRITYTSPTTVTYLDEVPLGQVNTGLLSMQIDPNFSYTGNNGSCSNSDCKSRGFDCCLENQCVKDGAVKPAASTQYSSLLQTAEQERLQNPMAYLNYPQLYYICGTTVPTTGGSGSGSGSTPVGYDPAFEQLKKDYKCVEHIKGQATTTPFHNELLSRATPYTSASECLTDSADANQTMYYQSVMKRLYNTCGCSQTELQDMISSCPAYEYSVVLRDTLGEPLRIDCYTPPNSPTTIPTNQKVSVSSRSAPHRFFDVNGDEKEISSGAEQEGAAFSYMDEGKVLPVQQNFSMNAILGQMSVTLDKALPAKVVSVELDQVYFISTTSGYYTPCPMCAKDSWLNTFTAYPASSTGTGLQAVGHTTQRDEFSTNTTAGNYEDTIFGRACWLPPTMIPFSHSAKSTVKEQRTARLETQSALFANGYQRDWFGFNKGALIGSFDGVSWFAIGKGRIVKTTSKKLFLAINAPFADLATPTLHVVQVNAYDGLTQAAQVDYDPEFHQYHPYQNEAGNCQKYHMCETDTDCVTQLGWEYACADVKDVKTNWPEFDGDGKEKANSAVATTIDQILLQKRFPSSSSKRCVYRGAGSICHSNAGSLSSVDLNKKKLLSCAPNFYCGNVNLAGLFNSKVARYAANLEEIPVSRNHLFGKDANILGRPLHYVASAESSSLTSVIRSTLNENLILNESSANFSTGLCQPGKILPTVSNQATVSNPFYQQTGADTSRRADFINQIATCNSTLFSGYRHSSCPVLGADGNYEQFSAGTLPSGYFARATNQNACGLESLLTTASLGASADTLKSSSPFRAIEAAPLNSQIILDRTLVRDACLRRAGAACHTDLDCSPNKMHASQVDIFGISFFGNAAEKSYYSEYLVCGQADSKPLPSDTEAFKNYDMTKNRCCREIGNDLTTYTSDLPTATAPNNYNADTVGLKMSMAPGLAPNDPKRYSRLATVENVGTSTRPILSAYQERDGSNFLRSNPSNSLGTNIKSPHQWKTLTEANSDSCCGGGWIRKFSDGSNDWSRRDRFVIDVTNFRCLNSRTPMITNPADVAYMYANNVADVLALVGQDYGDYCKDSTNTNGACAQYGIADSALDTVPEYIPANNYGIIYVNTETTNYSSTNPDYYFKPRSADGDPQVRIDYASTAASARRNITIRIPSYVPRSFDDAYTAGTLDLRMEATNASVVKSCVKTPGFNPTSPTDEYGGASCGVAGGCCHYSYDSASRVLKVAADATLRAGAFSGRKVGVAFETLAPGYLNLSRTKPGSSAYYLKRLGRLELSGIPQITFEAMTCNDNSNRLVPGIFKTGVNYLTDPLIAANSLTNPNNSFRHTYQANTSSGTANVTNYFTTAQGLQSEPVFSANDFKCCSPLGKTVKNATLCCSGYAYTDEDSGVKTCALPAGTDLMIYFNRFVSNEGVGADKPGGGLLEADFDASTGEPIISAAVNDKIRELGASYCASGKVRQGAAFGNFVIEPQGSETNLTNKIYNIVDSPRDYAQNSNAGTTVAVGYNAFIEGFRWNHHLYCTEPQD